MILLKNAMFSCLEFLPEDSLMIVPSMEMPSIEDYVDNSLIDVGIPAQAAKEFEKDLDIANSSDSDGDGSLKVEEPDSLKVQELALGSTQFKDSEEEEDDEDKLAEGLSFADDEEAVHEDAAKEPGEENVLGMLGAGSWIKAGRPSWPPSTRRLSCRPLRTS